MLLLYYGKLIILRISEKQTACLHVKSVKTLNIAGQIDSNPSGRDIAMVLLSVSISAISSGFAGMRQMPPPSSVTSKRTFCVDVSTEQIAPTVVPVVVSLTM